MRPDDDLATLVADAVARGADALGVAGGDGSLAIVAAAARARASFRLRSRRRNHFALDLGIDRHDLVGSLDAFTDGVERRIDVAEVNGRLFLNNVSLGIYGDAVRQPTYRDAKAQTLLETAAKSSDRARLQPNCSSWTTRATRIATLRSCSCRTTPTRSNPRMHPAPGRRSTADSSASSSSTRHEPAGAGRTWTAVRLELTAPPVHAGVDGEAVDLTPPLEFVIRPGALRVRISSSHPGRSPSARLL